MRLTIKPDIDEVKYVPGAVIWKVDRKDVMKSNLRKLIGTELYAHMTISNCNTVRGLHERLSQGSYWADF